MRINAYMFSGLVLSLFMINTSCSSSKIISGGKLKTNDGKRYIVYKSDHEDPDDVKGVLNPKYESIYIMPLKNYTRDKQKKGYRISEVGYRRQPVWNKKGNLIAFFAGDEIDSIKFKLTHIEVYNVLKNEINKLEDLDPCWCGISWDASGNLLAFGEIGKNISIYNFEKNKKVHVLKYKSYFEGLSLSPDGQHVVFMTRDGEHMNDDDAWRLNLYSLGAENVIKIGLTNDRFGVIGPFLWKNDATEVLFRGFLLDDQDNRTYSFWTYHLSTQELNPFAGDLQDYNQQRIRYWKANYFH